MDDELRFHIDSRTADLARGGMPLETARRRARAEFGNPEVWQERCRESRGLRPFDDLLGDARFAARGMRKQWLVSTAVVLTLAIGIAGNVSILAFVHALLFAPGPGTNPERLVWVTHATTAGDDAAMEFADFDAYDRHARQLDGVAGYHGVRAAMTDRPGESLWGHAVTGAFFDVVQVNAELGRTLGRDDVDGRNPVVVLSHSAWQRRFNGRQDIVGAPLKLAGRIFTVVGVMPAGFRGLVFGENVQIWVPIDTIARMPRTLAWKTSTEEGQPSVLARLAPGVPIAQAQSELEHIRAAQEGPTGRHARVLLHPVVGGLAPSDRSRALPLMTALAALPALLLMVACANAGNLRLARAMARQRELWLRRALGATRWRIVRQLVTESALLALAATVSGIVLSYWLSALLVRVAGLPANLAAALSPNAMTMLASFTVTLLVVVLVGLAPALAATHGESGGGLKEQRGDGGGSQRTLRQAFVIAQVAAAVTLIVVAALFFQSVAKAVRIDPGFVANDVVMVRLDAQASGLGPEQGETMARDLLRALREIDGVESAALTSFVPLTPGLATVRVSGDAPAPRSVTAGIASVSEGYFLTMGQAMVSGREFAAGERSVAVVSETFARQLWNGEPALGQRVRIDGTATPPREVIGIARDVNRSLAEAAQPFLYVPAGSPSLPAATSIVLRADRATAMRQRIAGRIRTALPGVRADTVILAGLLRSSAEKQQSLSAVISVFGWLALAIAALGIYGVTAHAVALRTQEMGIRLSLGAAPFQVTRLIVGEALGLSSAGIAVGICGGAIAAVTLRHLLFGLVPADAAAVVACAVLVAVITVAAAYVPARRAAAVDPAITLRCD